MSHLSKVCLQSLIHTTLFLILPGLVLDLALECFQWWDFCQNW